MITETWIRRLMGCIGWLGLLALVAGGGCDNANRPAGGGLFGDGQGGREKWTIRCARMETPDHRTAAKTLGDLLGQVRGLQARDVRVVSDAAGSTIYYGEYTKVASPDGGLVFPPEYQRDIELIRSLAYRQQTPFFFAGPEPLTSGGAAPGPAQAAEGDISTAKGTHSLQIAVFYNTPTYDQRRQDAETYVRLLREQGYAAYYFHEAVKTFVFVGDFDESDIVTTPQGWRVYGPRVQQLIARNPDEFKYMLENGHIVRYTNPEGKTAAQESVLMPVPRPAAAGTTR